MGIREPREVKKKSFDLGGNRTHDLRIRSTVTLPTELRGRTEKVGDDSFKNTTSAVAALRFFHIKFSTPGKNYPLSIKGLFKLRFIGFIFTQQEFLLQKNRAYRKPEAENRYSQGPKDIHQSLYWDKWRCCGLMVSGLATGSIRNGVLVGEIVLQDTLLS